ncbi:MAG: hypothetical protein MUE53_10100, partial [Chitinophagales bacterium]|nr:hypothetical protein [Chitinophagales bacterium]
RNEKGRQIRKYFIEVEKRAREIHEEEKNPSTHGLKPIKIGMEMFEAILALANYQDRVMLFRANINQMRAISNN